MNPHSLSQILVILAAGIADFNIRNPKNLTWKFWLTVSAITLSLDPILAQCVGDRASESRFDPYITGGSLTILIGASVERFCKWKGLLRFQDTAPTGGPDKDN